MLSQVLYQWRSITSNRFVLNMVQVNIFSLGHTVPCSITSGSSMWRQLQLTIPLSRGRWMSCFLREQLNHLLVVLVSIPVCLLFLNILVASGPYVSLSGLIVICIYLLSRCLLSDMSGSLFSMVFMLSPLISMKLIYIFLLFSIIIIFYDFLAQCAISVEGFTFWAGYSL